MIPLPKQITPQDVNQWLQHGWFVAEYEGNQIIGQLREFNGETMYMYDLKTKRVKQVMTESVRVHWPMCGAINVGPIALYIIRRQLKQWRRTYNSRQVHMQIPRKWEAMKVYGDVLRDLSPDAPDVVAALFDPTYPVYDDAREDIQQGVAFSRALSPHIILAGTPDTLLVYNRGDLAGRIMGGRILPIGADEQSLARLLKHFDGRITL
jgi:hypothetical protein